MSFDRLQRDRRGLPVPHIAAWSSEHWSAARWDPVLPGRQMALFTAGRQGRGSPCFDVMNEPRQRRAVMLGRCQVCDDPLPRHERTSRPTGWLPASVLVTEELGHLDDGTPVTAEPLCCRSCAEFVVEHCCVLARRPERNIVHVVDWVRVAQFIDPSAAPALHARRFDATGDVEHLGRVARRHGGLVGLIKVGITRTA